MGVRNHVAASNRSAAARAGPPVAPPATGWPGTKRGSAIAPSVRFVEATSVTTTPSPTAASTSCTTAGAAPTGTATTTSSASATASRERRRRLQRAARSGLLEHVASESNPRQRVPARPAARATDVPSSPVPTTARRSTARAAEQVHRGRRGSAPVGRDLLLQHVEDGREDRADAALGERTRVRGDERLQQLGLALGIDPALAGRVLVVAHRRDELEPPVQEREQLPVELGDLAPKSVELAHAACSSPASTATASRFAGGASGQTQPGSYEQDGL